MRKTSFTGTAYGAGGEPPQKLPGEGEDQPGDQPREAPRGAEGVADVLKEYGQIFPPEQRKAKNPRGNIAYLPIIGHIEGHITMPSSNKTTKYEHVIPLLLNFAENPDTDGVLVILNTVGGDVEAGLAIAELIAGMSKPTVGLVLGGGHSIGVPLAVAADYSFIAPTATMTIHPVRMNGTIVSVPQTFEYFNKIQERILDFTVKNSRISKPRFRELMMETEQLAFDVGTILVGEEAVSEKLIDQIGGLNDALEKLYDMIAAKKPKAPKSGSRRKQAQKP